MKVWKLDGDYSGRLCFDVGDGQQNKQCLYNFHDKNYVNDWPGLKVTFTCGKKRRDILPLKNVTSFSSFGSLFICDEYAKEKISEKYNCIQFLPVEPIEKDINETTSYYIPNVLTTAKVLDEEKTKFKYISDKYVYGIDKYYFVDADKETPVFYLNACDYTFSTIYVTDEFKDYVESCGITGFVFKEVFDFDNPDKEYPLM